MPLDYDASLRRAARELERFDAKPITGRRGELRMFMVVRNESLRLPYLLRYYFRRGVDRLFVIDNDSADDTLEVLRARDHVHVYQTAASYAGHWRWMEYLLERHGLGHWCLVVDADEILRYPSCDIVSIKDLCAFLAEEGLGGLHCLLLDMYSKRAFAALRYRAGEDPLACCPYFDPDSHEVVTKSTLNPKRGEEITFQTFHKGVRYRVFGTYPLLSKIPLFYYRPQTYLSQGMHALDGARLAGLQGVVMHIKYLQDFPDRVAVEAERKVYYHEALDYRKMQQRQSRNPVTTFYNESSVRYQNDEQLVRLGLMRDDETWRRCVQAKTVGDLPRIREPAEKPGRYE